MFTCWNLEFKNLFFQEKYKKSVFFLFLFIFKSRKVKKLLDIFLMP